MATLPSASTRLDDSAGPAAAGSKYVCVLAPVSTLADGVPRVYYNSKSMAEAHGYAQGVDYSAYHMGQTKLPVIFVPMPIATAGTVGRFNTSGNTNTSVCTVAVGSSGSLDEIDGVVKVVTGGVVGTAQIVLSLSLDGGVSFYTVKLGTATSYAITTPIGAYPVGLTLSFAGGSLTAGDTILTFHSTAPMWDSAGMTAARTALANQNRRIRDILVAGEVSTAAMAGYVQTLVNDYELTDERYTGARVALRDRYPYAVLSQTRVNMTGAPTITFLEVGVNNDTITRGSGSFVADGFVTGDTIRITGAVASAGANNISAIATVAAGVITLAGAEDLVSEGPIAGVSITSEMTLTFGDNGASPDTITRNSGSWLADGFRVGDTIAITGTASNNVSKVITVLTSTVLSVATGSFAAEVIGSYGVSVIAGETKSVWLADLYGKMAAGSITSKRMNLGFGRGRMNSPFLASNMRRSVIWDDSVISYQHDLHIPTFAVNPGGPRPSGITGSNLNDTAGNLYEFDQRRDGGATEAGFTAYTTRDGYEGCFIALSLTRAADSSLLSRQQNMAVANLAQAICQTEAVRILGKVLVRNADGTPTSESIGKVKSAVDGALKRGLLIDAEKEGQRASDASWDPDPNTDLSTPGTLWPCTMTLKINNTVEQIATTIKVQ